MCCPRLCLEMAWEGGNNRVQIASQQHLSAFWSPTRWFSAIDTHTQWLGFRFSKRPTEVTLNSLRLVYFMAYIFRPMDLVAGCALL